jgi:hypothetical protein
MTAPTFLSPPAHYTLPEFRALLGRLTLGAWRPKFPTLHNTGVPSLKQWQAMGATPQERWGGNLNRYYQGMGWHAGPHLVVCPDYVWALCDLTKPGVSVSCWNSETFGIEMVGNYEVGDNAAAVLAALAEKFEWGDLADFALGYLGLHFHHDCARDHHACPGSKVGKPDVLARVESVRSQLSPLPRPPAPVTLALAPVPLRNIAPARVASVDDIQAALNRLGMRPQLTIDGSYGPATHTAVKTFQSTHGCFVDGWAGPETCKAIEGALAITTQQQAA